MFPDTSSQGTSASETKWNTLSKHTVHTQVHYKLDDLIKFVSTILMTVFRFTDSGKEDYRYNTNIKFISSTQTVYIINHEWLITVKPIPDL